MTSEWKRDGSLVYRLSEEGYNCDEINVTQIGGRRAAETREIAAESLLQVLAILPSDLGGLTVLEHLQRMAEDAARWRELRACSRLRRVVVLELGFGFSSNKSDAMGSETYLDEVFDECRELGHDAWGADL